MKDPPVVTVVTLEGRSWALTPAVNQRITEANTRAAALRTVFYNGSLTFTPRSGFFAAVDYSSLATGQQPLVTASVSSPAPEGRAYPRYTAVETGPTTVINIVQASTTLLVPYAVAEGAYDTGIALANTLADPFGASSRDYQNATPRYEHKGVVVTFPLAGTDSSPTSTANQVRDKLEWDKLDYVRAHLRGDAKLIVDAGMDETVAMVTTLLIPYAVSQGDYDTGIATAKAHAVAAPAAVSTTSEPLKPTDLITFTLGVGVVGGTPLAPIAINPETAQAAPVDTTAQSALAFMDNAVVYARSAPGPSADWRGLLASLINPTRPRLSSAAVGGPVTSSWRQVRATPTERTPRLKVFVTSLGHLGADAFRVVIVNESIAPVALGLGDLVLEPVAGVTEREVQRELAARSRFPQRTFTVPGYCLERDKNPPAAGMVFRLAPAEAQARNASMSRVVRAAKHLRDRNAFKPDADPDEYYHSTVQWSIWTLEQKLDERSFSRAFVEHVRKRVIAGRQRWTSEIEKAVVALAPARWQAIQLVLREAGVAAR